MRRCDPSFSQFLYINNVISNGTKLFRFPGGEKNKYAVSYLNEHKFTIYRWDVDPFDWVYYNDPTKCNIIVDRVHNGWSRKLGWCIYMRHPGVKPNAIILLHDNRYNKGKTEATLKALPDILEMLIKDGYQFKTLERE